MTDTVSKRKRSEIMSLVKSKDSKFEVDFRKAFWKKGFRYRKNSNKYFGKPDIVIKKYKTVIFLDSCFWHGCKKHCRIPSSQKKYWVEKIARNIKRDKLVTKYYKNIGWNIFRFWEHTIKNNLNKAIENLSKNILTHSFKN